MSSSNSSRYEKIESRRKCKHAYQGSSHSNSSNINNIRTNSLIVSNDNLSYNDIQINKQCARYNKHYSKNDISFRNDHKVQRPSQKIIIEITSSNPAQKVSQNPGAYRTITHSNSPLKNEKNNLSNIRKAFFNINKRTSFNITPIKRRVKSPQVLGVKDRIIKSTSQGKKDTHVNNSSNAKKNERIIISTLPRAMIDISKSDTRSFGLNITYNNDEIVNMYLKLKSKNTKLTPSLIAELKSLRDEIDNFIKKYNS